MAYYYSINVAKLQHTDQYRGHFYRYVFKTTEMDTKAQAHAVFTELKARFPEAEGWRVTAYRRPNLTEIAPVGEFFCDTADKPVLGG